MSFLQITRNSIPIRSTPSRATIAGSAIALLMVCGLGNPQAVWGQPIFRQPQLEELQPLRPSQSAQRQLYGFLPTDNIIVRSTSSGPSKLGRIQLPSSQKLAGPSLLPGPSSPRPALSSPRPLRQGFESENSTLKELSAGGGFIPTNQEPQSSDVPFDLPALDLEQLGIAEPQVDDVVDALGQSSNSGATAVPPLDIDLADSSETKSSPGREQVVENYPDGRPRLIRSVMLDKQGNYYNDGPWIVKDRAGRSVAAGRFRKGIMIGQWGRRHTSAEGGMFTTKPFNLFQEPFDSIASFDNGKLDGQWAIFDRARRTVFEINYENGIRHGSATWFYPDTSTMRQATFKQGMLHGEVSQWDEDGKLTSKEYYHEGRKVVRNRSFYRPNVPRQEAYFLDVRLEQDGLDNWWSALPAPYLASGQRVQAGQARAWYSNRQLQYRGQYRDDQPVGQFFWWHENGNRSVVGQFDRQGKRTGRWIWWHENGLKNIEGSFRAGEEIGRWRAWDVNGRLVKDKNYDRTDQSDTPETGIQSVLDLEDDDDRQPPDSAADPAKETGTDSDDLNSGDPFEVSGTIEALPLPDGGSLESIKPLDLSEPPLGEFYFEELEDTGPEVDDSLLTDESA